MLAKIAQSFRQQAPAVEAWWLRVVDGSTQSLSVRQDVLLPPFEQRSRGVFVQIADRGGIGYAATADVTPAGLKRAAQLAQQWAHATADLGLVGTDDLPLPAARGEHATPVARSWDSQSLADKVGVLQDASRRLRVDGRIVDWSAHLRCRLVDTLLVTSAGGEIRQRSEVIVPALVAVANEGSQTQVRTGGGAGAARQGGLEQLVPLGFPHDAERIAEEALALLTAPECPSGVMDLLLLPSQMTLQIHESIGHPLEMDRILGDERNYAGTSFVTLDMFGSYRYGSELLNVTFDPSRSEQLASYVFDDEGSEAQRTYIIRNGILERPLGGACSQSRSGLPGVANARACDWNRPPIDRMANLNVEPGDSTLDALVSRVERGVLMDTNRSWSIDDSRNKFQFGCQLGRLIEDGEVRGLVRNPNYRGVSASFWRNLIGVGNESTFDVLGVTNCGKGEPNQSIYVGHAAPACLFAGVDVFGGAS